MIDPFLELEAGFAFLRLQLALVKLQRLAAKANFRPDQPRDDRGRWTLVGGPGVVVTRNDRTGNPKIDRTTDLFVDMLKDVVVARGEGSGPAYGLAVHTDFAAQVRDLDLPGIGRDGVEQTFSMGDLARYGISGSVRTDVVLRDGQDRKNGTGAPTLNRTSRQSSDRPRRADHRTQPLERCDKQRSALACVNSSMGPSWQACA